MKMLVTLLTVLWLSGCAGMMHVGSMSKAYKKYDEGEYQETLRLLSQAHNADASNEDAAEIAYLKAKAYEGLGDRDKAESLYRYVAEQHAESQWGYLAQTHLK